MPVTTTYMGLTIPDAGPSGTAGPTYATMVNTDLSLLDAHDHSPGKGTTITTAGLNINADLPLNGFNAKTVRALRFSNQSVNLTPGGAEIGEVYVYAGDLWFINSSGVAIQLTSGGAINFSTAGAITGMGSTSAAVTYSNAAKTFSFTQAGNQAAALDGGSLTIREQVVSGNGVTIKAPTALAASYTLTLPPALPGASETRLVTMDTSGNLGNADDPTITSRVTFQGVNLGNTSDTTVGNVRWSGTAFEGYRNGAWRELEGWEYLGSVQLGVAANSMTLSSIPARDVYEVLIVIPSLSVGDTLKMQLNADTAANYGWRSLDVGTGAVTVTDTNAAATTSCQISGVGGGALVSSQPYFARMTLNNPATKTKAYAGTMHQGQGGALNQPVNLGLRGEWNNTANQVNAIKVFATTGTTTLAIGSSIAVFGKNLV